MPVTINKGLSGLENIEVKINGIALSNGTFNGKGFAGRDITLTWTNTGDADANYSGWDIALTKKNGAVTHQFQDGQDCTFAIANDVKKVDIKLLKDNNIDGVEDLTKQLTWRIVGTQLVVTDVERGTAISLYDMAGRLLYQGKANDSQVIIPLGRGNQSYILKAGNYVQKIR